MAASIRSRMRPRSDPRFHDVEVGLPLDELPYDGILCVLDLVHRSHLADLALEKHRDTRGNRIGASHVVRNDDAGDAKLLTHPDHELIDDSAGDRIKSGGWLIVQDVLGLSRNRAGDAYALSHSAGQFGWELILHTRKIDELQSFADALYYVPLTEPPLFTQSHGNVVANRKRIEQRCELEHITDVGSESVQVGQR